MAIVKRFCDFCGCNLAFREGHLKESWKTHRAECSPDPKYKNPEQLFLENLERMAKASPYSSADGEVAS